MLNLYPVKQPDVLALTAVVALIAAVIDLRSHRIPNWLTCSAALAGLCYYTWAAGTAGLMTSTGGLLLGLALLVPFYCLGGMGAGDVKLMAALGALLGPAGIFKAWLFTAMAGGVYALALLVIRRGNGNHLMNGIASLYTSAFLALSAKSAGSFALANNVGRPKLCYGVAIAAGTLLSLFIQM